MKENRIRFLFAGDFYSTEPDKIRFSENLQMILNSCDVRCINFEAPLPVGKLTIPNNNILKQSLNSSEWCEKHNFDIVSLANNHMYDYGKEGVLATIKSFYNSITIGAGNWQDAYNVKIITVKGINIGFFSGTSCDLASLKDEWTDKDKIGCAWINNNKVNNILQEAKSKCDYLFVLSHAGVEFMNIPLPEWRDRYRSLIDAGADAVIGSHPHVPQGVENYKGKPIFYSLGNFWFENKIVELPLFWENGILAVLELNNGMITFNSVPIIRNNDLIEIDTTENTLKHLKYLSNILTDDEEYVKQVNIDVIKFYNKFKIWLLNGFNAREMNFEFRNILSILKTIIIGRVNLKSAMHQIRDESTRWTLIRALKLISKSDL